MEQIDLGPSTKNPLPVPSFQLEEAEIALDEDDVPLFLGRGSTRERKTWRIWLWTCPSKKSNLVNIGIGVFAVFIALMVILFLSSRGKGHSNEECSPIDFFATMKSNVDFLGQPRAIQTSRGAVASDHSRCSEQGVDILELGGNAVDALVTTVLCLGIMNPMSSGVGGGGFILVRMANGNASVIDAREVAPASASQDMFAGSGSWGSTIGGRAVAVPLELKGLEKAHKMYGRLEWESIVQPAIDLADNGFDAHRLLVDKLTRSKLAPVFKDFAEAFMVEDCGTQRPPRIGELCCKRPQLADSLRKCKDKGVDALYEEWAPKLEADVAHHTFPGILTAQDILNAEVVVKTPITAKIFGMDALVPPLPSSGAVLLLALKILEKLPWPVDDENLQYHWIVEALKHAFAVRMHCGDPMSDEDNYFANLMEDITSDAFAEKLVDMLKDDGISSVEAYGGEYHFQNTTVETDHGTSHISIVDEDRNAVSMTSTINGIFGSHVYSASTGVLLNNEMDDFSRPDRSNMYGLSPSVPNYILPGKKPLSSMSPLILVKDGVVAGVFGGSGGPHIISAILQTVVHTMKNRKSVFDAISTPRVHHQLIPYIVEAEADKEGPLEWILARETQDFLRSLGNNVTEHVGLSEVQAILFDAEEGVLNAASDPRKDGAPAGQQ